MENETRKVSLAEFGLLPKIEDVEVTVNGVTFAVHSRIPYEELLNALQWCIDYVISDQSFVSEPIKKIAKDFAVIKFFTNIDIGNFDTVSDFYASYDLLCAYGLMEEVIGCIDEKQLNFFYETLDSTVNSIIAYRNSALGLVQTLSESAKANSNSMQEALDMLDNDKAQKLLEVIGAVSAEKEKEN